jgi:hypothetical protein
MNMGTVSIYLGFNSFQCFSFWNVTFKLRLKTNFYFNLFDAIVSEIFLHFIFGLLITRV